MTTNARPPLDLWIDDDELDELAASFDRLIDRAVKAPSPRRTTFYADYHDAE